MALIRCRECRGKMSSEASVCPRCGAPSVGPETPSGTDAKKAEKPASNTLTVTVVVLGVIALPILAGLDQSGSVQKPDSLCHSDWKQCLDNTDLVKNWPDYNRVRVECEFAANRSAKYGTPIWPTYYFDSYIDNKTALRTGSIVLIEDNAQFQNGFGAMVHSTVRCSYDLSSMKVVDVSVEPNG